jgi:hypothetical protein
VFWLHWGWPLCLQVSRNGFVGALLRFELVYFYGATPNSSSLAASHQLWSFFSVKHARSLVSIVLCPIALNLSIQKRRLYARFESGPYRSMRQLPSPGASLTPYVDLFWSRSLCDPCKYRNEYREVTAVATKKYYSLTEDDFLTSKHRAQSIHIIETDPTCASSLESQFSRGMTRGRHH